MNEENKHSQAKTTKKRFHTRGFVSLLLTGSFLVMLVTGLVLYVTPQGRVAHWTGWTLAGLGKEQWSAVHIVTTLVFLGSAGFHLYYNWRVFWGYFKSKAKSGFNLQRELALAIAICVATVAGTLWDVPPFGTVIRWNDDIKAYWDSHSPAAPVPHAEGFSLARLADEINVPADQIVEGLKTAGVTVADPSMSVQAIADENGMTPDELFSLAAPDYRGRQLPNGAFGAAGAGKRHGGGMGLGAGRGRGSGRGQQAGRGQGRGLGRGNGVRDNL